MCWKQPVSYTHLNAEHFTVQVNSSIGVLPNDRFSESGVTGKLTLPEGTREMCIRDRCRKD